ncbi:mucin-4 isoform X2 [Emydura macquarii macquarii]|uniref:mucin-4 isoform X2 n=1 Tax=Emydura macquarii macquarii TaxID=1129001 RepID=UPI00352A4321
MGTWRPRAWAFVGCWMWILCAGADLGPTSAAPASPEGQRTLAEGVTPGSASPLTAGSNWRADERSPAAQVPPTRPDGAAKGEMTLGPAESSVSASSFPREAGTTRWVWAASRDTESSFPGPAAGSSSSPEAETPPEAAATLASGTDPSGAWLENGTAATEAATEAAARAWLYSSLAPFSSAEAELGASRAAVGTVQHGTGPSPPSAAAAYGTAAPGGPGAMASSAGAGAGDWPFSPSVVETVSARAAFPSVTVSRETAAAPSDLETKNPGSGVSSTLESPHRSPETSAIGGGQSSPAFAARGDQAVSQSPAEAEGDGVSPSTFPGLTDSGQLSPDGQVAGEGRGVAADQDPPRSPLETSPVPADDEPSPAGVGEPLTRVTEAQSGAGPSPPWFPEPSPVPAPTRPGETSPWATTSPSDSPDTGASSAGVSGAPRASQLPPDTAPLAAGEAEGPAGSARETPFPPSVHGSQAPAAASRGPAGGRASGGATAPPSVEQGPGSPTSAAREAGTVSSAESQRGTSPAPPAPMPRPGNAEAPPWALSGDGAGTDRHPPSAGMSPPAFAPPRGAPAEPPASRTTKAGSSPTSFPGAPASPPASSEREPAPGAASSTGGSAFPGLQAVTGGALPATRPATSRTPPPHPERGDMAPGPGAPGPSAAASQVLAATTPARRRGLAGSPLPLLGATALQHDIGAGSEQESTAPVSAGISEATASGMGQSATLAAVSLYPYGAKENDKEYVERSVDFNSPIFKPEIGFPFGKKLRDFLYFTDNGLIIFPALASDVFPYPSPPPGGFNGREKVPMVAVFWDNADFSKGVGTTFYQEFLTLNSAKHPLVRDVEAKIQRYLRTPYSAKWTLKITWEKAPAYSTQEPVGGTNTYQAVLTTDGLESYALRLYQEGSMQWDYTKLAATDVLVGYSSGDGLYRNDDLTRWPPAAKYRPDQFRGDGTDLRGLWLSRLESRVRVNYRTRCLDWVNMQHDPAVWNKDLPPCPCSLPRGALDHRYSRSSAGMADARVTMLFTSSPNQSGAGARCLYNSRNEFVDGWQERSWKHSRQASPSRDSELKMHDWCCHLAGSPQLCAKYSQKRPKVGCAGYRRSKQN